MKECPFCKMFSGEIETRKIYEDENVLGIVDIQPRFAKGQCLIIPRSHIAQFYELEDEHLFQLFKGVKTVASKIRQALNAPFVAMFSRGMGVPIHAHIILYPSSGEDPVARVLRSFVDYESIFRTSRSELDEIAEKIRLA